MDFIHNLGIVHKDLHPGNVFISQTYERMLPHKDPIWSFKIGDLGICRLEGDQQLFNTMAPWMIPPEFYNPVEYAREAMRIDIYHVGLLLLSILLKANLSFTKDQVLSGFPRILAERNPSAVW